MLPLDVSPASASPGSAPPLRSVVVVGAGLAGARSVAELRGQGFTGAVTLVGAEPLVPYDRPPLSKHLLDRTEPAWLVDELGVDVHALADDVRLGVRATDLEVGADGVVVATDAGAVEADAVVVATGSHAVRPAGWEAALTLHTAADAAVLRTALGHPGATAGRRLVVVGAGWIGAEVAGAAAAAGMVVTVVEAGAAPLEQALGHEVGSTTVPWFAAAGVDLRTRARVVAVEHDGVELDDGTRLAADVVLAAVGARPSTAWLRGALVLEPDGSARVDEAHVPVGGSARVRVVGDAALRRSARHGWVRGGHWDAALRGPAVAVAGLLGLAPAEPDPAPYVWSAQLGHELTLYGVPGADDEVVLRGEPGGADGWTVLWFARGTDRVTAVFVVDRPRDVAGARRLLAGPDLPVVDRTRARDLAVPLARAVVATPLV